MPTGGRSLLVGVGTAVAVSFPGVVLAQITTAVLDEGAARAVLVGGCLALVLAGPVAGGVVVGRAQPTRPWLLGAAVGAIGLTAVAAFGTLLRQVADGDAEPAILPSIAVLGALLGVVGAALGRARAGRTRR